MVHSLGGVGALRLVCGFLVVTALISGCKKKEESDEPLKLPEKKTESSASASASAAATAAPGSPSAEAPSASASAAAVPTASATPGAEASATAEAASTGTPAAVGGGNIDNCCAALRAIQTSGVSKETKVKAGAAALACNGIAKLVKTGKTSRAAALTQVRAALGGATAPAACH